jgi:DNA-binding response OmpR family regulator
MRLLVIEDHPVVLQVLCRVLRCGGAHIASATTVRSAKQRVMEDDPYDVVICENQLSDGTALELLGWLRWQQQIGIPFLLIARKTGMDFEPLADFSVLETPFRPEHLLARLDALLCSAEGLIARQIPFAAERTR